MEGIAVIVSAEGSEKIPLTKVIKAKDYMQSFSVEEFHANTQQKIIDEKNAVRLELEKIYAEKNKEGYEQGYNTGKMEIAQQITDTAIKAGLYIDSLEDRLVDTIIHAVRMIIDDLSEETITEQSVRKALKYIRSEKQCQLLVSPNQVSSVNQRIEQIFDKMDGGPLITVQPDQSLLPGDCVVETEMGSIDLCLKTQLNIIREAITKRIKVSKNEAV